MVLWGIDSTGSDRLHDPSSFFSDSSTVQLLAELQSLQDRVDDLEGKRDLMAFQIGALSNLSRMALDQASSLSGRVGTIEIRDDLSLATAVETEEASSARVNITESQMRRYTKVPDATLDSNMASLEASLDHLLDDDEIKQGHSSAERINPVFPPGGNEDSGVETGAELQTSDHELSEMKVKTFGTPAAVQAAKEDQSSFHMIKSVGSHVVNFALHMVGPLFFGQSF